MYENIILQKKHYYMQILTNINLLRKNAEIENAEELLSDKQLNEILNIWRYTFVGLLREGLVYDYIKNNNGDESKDIVRLTIDNIQFDCPAIDLKEILQDEYDKLIIPSEDNMSNDFSLFSAKNEHKNAELEKEILNIKTKTADEINKLMYEANHDALTGTKNKRAFNEIQKELDNKDNYVVVAIDVNNLKTTNDTFGHLAGDKLLTTVSSALINAFPHCVYRIGGDEFSLIIKDSTDKEMIVAKLNDLVESLSKQENPCSFAYGIAVGENELIFSDIYKKADNLMYENKKQYKSAKENETNLFKKDKEEPKIVITQDKKEIIYNNKEEKIKDKSTFVYDTYDLTVLPPGGTDGTKIKALVAPLYISQNDTHAEIMVMLTDIYGRSETYVSENGLASIKINFNETELLIRGSFSNGDFKSFIMLAGTTMAMGCDLNKNAINEKRSNIKEATSYGHIAFTQFGWFYHIVPISLSNDENGIAHCLICAENINTKERIAMTTSVDSFTILKDEMGTYQILTYWQNNILCAEVLKN